MVVSSVEIGAWSVAVPAQPIVPATAERVRKAEHSDAVAALRRRSPGVIRGNLTELATRPQDPTEALFDHAKRSLYELLPIRVGCGADSRSPDPLGRRPADRLGPRQSVERQRSNHRRDGGERIPAGRFVMLGRRIGRHVGGSRPTLS